MRILIGAIVIALWIASTPALAGAGTLTSAQIARIKEAGPVLHEIRSVPDKSIPQELWDKAACVIVIPSLKKGAFVIGGEYGRGMMSCRHDGAWSAPVFMQVEKGSFGFQIGGQSIDLVLLVMNQSGAEKMLKNKVSLGVDASAAAGPVGRSAQAATDGQLKAEVLSYSRAQGLFAGIDLSGGALKPDTGANEELYGKNLTASAIVMDGTAQAPAATQPFMAALRGQSKAGK